MLIILPSISFSQKLSRAIFSNTDISFLNEKAALFLHIFLQMLNTLGGTEGIFPLLETILRMCNT